MSEQPSTSGSYPPDPAKKSLHERIDKDFSLQPVSPEVGRVLDLLRVEFKALAHKVVEMTPASREQSLALTELDSASRWAIAAVIRQ